MKKWLCPYIESQMQRLLDDICKVIPENEANYKRGLLRMAKDILDIPRIIKNRMDMERDARYKQIAEATRSNEKELN